MDASLLKSYQQKLLKMRNIIWIVMEPSCMLLMGSWCYSPTKVTGTGHHCFLQVNYTVMVMVHPEACSFYPSGSVSVDVRFVGFGKVTLDIDLLCTCDCTDNTVSYCVLSLLMMCNTRPHFIVTWGEMYDLRGLHDVNEIAFIESPMLFQTTNGTTCFH